MAGATISLACALEAAPANLAEYGRLFLETQPPPAVRLWQREISPRAPAALAPGTALLCEWDNPREVRAVQLVLAGAAPAAGTLRLEWWQRIWPDNGSGGWMRLDDPFNGRWATGLTTQTAASNRLELVFSPLSTNEVSGIKRTGFGYRSTYKLRLATSQPIVLQEFRIHSDAEMSQAILRFEFGIRNRAGRPHFEARNGRVTQTAFPSANSAVVQVEYADSTNRLSADRGYVICRRGETNSFSVFVDDALRAGGLYVRDLDVFVSEASQNLNYATWSGPKGEVWPAGVVEQVARMPEQSFAQVMQAIPLKPVPYMFLGCPNLRQEFALGPKGDLILRADSLRAPGPDLERRPWNYAELTYQFASGDTPGWWKNDRRQVTRSLEANWLPVALHEWRADGMVYRQKSVAAPLLESLNTLNSETGTEPIVLVNAVEITNTNQEPRTAQLWLALNHPQTLRLEADGLLILATPSDGTNRPGLRPVRGVFQINGKGRLEMLENPGNTAAPVALRYQVELGANETHQIELAIPYLELLSDAELAALKAARFEPLRTQVVNYWQERVARGMTYEVPDQFLNEFFQANLWHVLISTDIDPVTRQHQHGAATHHYPNFLNETMMVVRSLEIRGEHLAARQLIDTFLANQGVKGLPGNFKSKAGVLYAAHPTTPDPYTAQGYNMHHGWGLWTAADHYFWTKDAVWLKENAGKLVQACDWITRERQATKFKNPDGSRPLEYGLAPAGDLEDVEEYLYYYATDAYYYLGLKHAAAALQRINHPAAFRLGRDADAFKKDILASVAESVATSPVVQLKDGTWIPFVPPRVHALTHLKEGWIREGLYPALHLRDGEIYEATHPFLDWMIRDQEDNVFLSKESGYGVANPRANFFSQGGFTLQPNLVDLPITYLERDQVPNFLRGFYNTAWASLYPETMCFAEWVPAFGKGGGPLYKTPDECKFIQWMRQMLVLERGDRLELGLGVPRAWMRDGQRVAIQRAATLFGKLNLEIRSHVARGEIEATVHLSKMEIPSAISLRLRHPEGKPLKSAAVNGRPGRINGARQTIELPVKDSAWEIKAAF